LRLGAYQILFMDRVPDSAAVNESVRLARAAYGSGKTAGFVNAVLRSVSRRGGREEFPPFHDDPVAHISQSLSHPGWLVERWVREFGAEAARAVCAANNVRPPFTVRANTLRISRELLRDRFAASGIPASETEFSPDGLVLEKKPPVPNDPLFRDGMYFVQDEASQIVAHILAPLPGERVLDACAAPGGKTTHIAELMKDRGEIQALDLHKSKVRLILENCERLGITAVRPVEGDASRPLPFPAGLLFDRILLDAPCTGLGILHRTPEAKWRRKPEDIPRLARLQTKILDLVSARLKPGGVLVYSTCTMTPEENDAVVESFTKEHPDFSIEDLRALLPIDFQALIDASGFFRTYPGAITREGEYRMDGFFAARIKKSR
ncbi:MAG TPA: 16S rRNA (cytosine(967)-C(5))-methyltransferase RsmB, partial [Thermodesulfobacteriota bacterium]|nr:16S rRNA (cytosine(967)-C(5))-methyltransferase RsmB [Thermodesulfobacteriota bacterium]